MHFIYGTGNLEKLKQVTHFFREVDPSIEIKSLKDIGFAEDIAETGTTLVVRGKTKGKIAKEPVLTGGITYGSVFIPEAFTKVMNELSANELGNTYIEKAFLQLIEKLQERGIK